MNNYRVAYGRVTKNDRKELESYINHPRGVRFKGGKLFVSSIYKWFARDFGNSDRAIISHLQKYADEPLRGKPAGTARLTGNSYDWTLNEFKPDQ